MKRIVVCSDGTGNTAVKDRGTNVFKLFEAVDLSGHRTDANLIPQVAIYDDGVGTENFKPLKLFGGAFGWGLSRNVKHLYKELARIYDPGDEIYMFGFSRGAFTVRTLVGFIATCGLVDPQRLQTKTFGSLEEVVSHAYKAYRRCYLPLLWRAFGKPTRDAGANFKAAHGFAVDARIRFVGVWDTVDAVGLPFHIADFWNTVVYQFKFPDHKLSGAVDRACQALSIDDDRETFEPQLWEEQPGDANRLSQVWFAGVHSNIGGGYPKQGMSLVALDWMLSEAQRAGEPFQEDSLRINRIERRYFGDHANVDDKLYDARAGLGVFYRWQIRDISKFCRDHNVHPKVHLTVLERVAHGTDDYAPGNLPNDAEVVITTPDRPEDALLLRGRADGLQKVLRGVPDGTLLGQVRVSMRVGKTSYYLYLASCVMALLSVRYVRLSWIGAHPWLFLACAAVLVAMSFGPSYLLMLAADSHMDGVFSAFWYPRQTTLRDALKQARVALK